MTSIASNILNGKVLLASALVFALLTTVANAYSLEQEQLCTSDAMRLCSSEIPDVDRVTACMVRQQASLSPACKSVFRAPAATEYQATPVRASKPMSIVPAKLKRTGATASLFTHQHIEKHPAS
jgi:hypothetical protein